MSVEELWLGDTAVGTLAIPPGCTVTIDNVARCAGDGDISAIEADQRAFPLGVFKSRGAVEGHLENVSSKLWEERGLRSLTVVPSLRPVMSRVTPAATVMPLRTMFEQEALEAIAVSASVKVQPASAVAVTVDVEEPAAAAAELVPLLEEDAAEEAAEALLLAFAVELLDFLVEVDLLDDFLTFWTEAAEPV